MVSRASYYKAQRFTRLAQRERDRARLLQRPPRESRPRPQRLVWWDADRLEGYAERWDNPGETYSWSAYNLTTSTLYQPATTTYNDSDNVWRVTIYRNDRRESPYLHRRNEWEWQLVGQQERPIPEPSPVPAARQRLERRRAIERATELLDSVLSPEQRQTLADEGCIYVTGGTTGLRYRIRLGRQHNIKVINEWGFDCWDVCVHVQPNIPDADNVAAQVLALQYNEALLIRTANLSPMASGIAALDPRVALERVA